VLSSARLGDETGGRLGPSLRLGAGGRSPIPRPAWRTDHPSAGASELQPRTWRGRNRGLPRRTLEDKGVGMRRSRFSDTPQGKVARPAKRQAAVGGGRAGRSSRPTPDIGHGPRARARTPCSSFIPSGGQPRRGSRRFLSNRAHRLSCALPTRPLKPLRAQPTAGHRLRGCATRRREEAAGPGS